MRTITCLLFVCFLSPILSSPFAISYPLQDSLTEEDLLAIQKQKQTLDISSLLDTLYPKKSFWPWSPSLASKEDFKGRISKAFHQTLIDPSRGFLPEKHLVKINGGSDRCIVCYASFDGVYPGLIKQLPEHLEKTGFQGYLFYQIGGFPNPTGQEIRFCAVPYSFKVFSLLEAKKLGFHKVLWIDSVFIPLKDPSPLFEQIEQEGYFFKRHSTSSKFILPSTRKYLQEKTGSDVLHAHYVSAQVLGLDLNTPLAKQFIEEYYKLVEDGMGFFSCFPEEYVYTAILASKLPSSIHPLSSKLVFSEVKFPKKDLSWAKQQGYFFIQKAH